MSQAAVKNTINPKLKLVVQIIVALILATSSILVGYWQFYKDSSSVVQFTYVGRVVDQITEAPIRRAKVILEIQGAPPIVYTDSEGIYQFLLKLKSNEVVEGRIRVQASGYENFDRNVSISYITRLEDIRLTLAKDQQGAELSELLRQKLAVALGSSLALLGLSTGGAGKPLFEQSLKELGLPDNQIRELYTKYTQLDEEIRTRRLSKQEIQKALADLRSSAITRVTVLDGNQSVVYIQLGEDLTCLLLVLRGWDRWPVSGDLIGTTQICLISLQRSVPDLDLPERLIKDIQSMRETTFNRNEDRIAAAAVFEKVLDYYDMEPFNITEGR